jgi:probable HAF family extracellular repeat protein
MKRLTLTLAIAGVLSLMVGYVRAAVFYTLTDLGPGVATAVNAGGQVAGWSGDQAFLYSSGTRIDRGTLGGAWSRAADISADGIVVGRSLDADGNSRAFLDDGSMHDIGPGQAFGINDLDEVVGATDSTAFLYDGAMHDLGTLGGGTSEAKAINGGGTAVGRSDTSSFASHAFLYDGAIHDLGTLPGGNYSNATDINAAGIVIGLANNAAGEYHAFLYDGVMHDLGTLPGFSVSSGLGINASGQVVGGLTGSAFHAFLYDNGSMFDLNTLVVNLGGWTLWSAEDINDSGAIVGSGVVDGTTHAFLLTPVPEPSTLMLVVVGLIGLLGCAWQAQNGLAYQRVSPLRAPTEG